MTDKKKRKEKTVDTGLDHVKTVEGKNGPEIYGEGGFYVQPLFVRRVPSRDWERFVKNVKMLIRGSVEYKKFIADCKENGLNRCAFISNVEDENATIEIHHAILTLHEVVEIVADHMSTEAGITTLAVAHEVMKAHFDGLISVVPLSETIHQLVHAGEVKIDVRQVYGDVIKFIKTYYRGITAEHILRIKKAIDESKEGNLHKENMFMLPSPEEINRNPQSTFDAIECAYNGL